MNKTCKSCGIEKPVSDFTKRAGSNDGYHIYCRECNNKKIKLSKQRAKLKDKIKIEYKTCSSCKEQLHISNFYKYKLSKDGYMYRCKACDAEATKTARKNKKELYSIMYRKRNLKSKYNMGIDDYESLLASQNYACAICGTKNPAGENSKKVLPSFAVDHEHISGRIRGLLCNTCNRALGFMRDSPELLKSAANYLETH